MKKMQYSLVGTEDGSNITVFVPGTEPLVAHSSHANFNKIVEGVLANDENVIDLFDVATAAATKFNRLTERVTTANGRLYFDGEEVDNSLATQVVRFLGEGVENWKPLVAFFENVQQNPLAHSREQLYTWLDARDFTITDDGLIVGYKGVTPNGDEFLSIFTGKAIVDGEVHDGHIPNRIGSVVEMPRNEVRHDPDVGCSYGLHVGTWDYAENFSRGAVLEVHVNPRDVVSVPTSSEKMRTCRYTVIKQIDVPYTEAVIWTSDFYDGWGDHEDEEECVECGSSDVVAGEDLCHDCLDELAPEDDHEEVEELTVKEEDEVSVGDVFEDRDSRRQGRTFRVESIEGDFAVGKSLPQNLTRKVRLDRLTSRKYRKV